MEMTRHSVPPSGSPVPSAANLRLKLRGDLKFTRQRLTNEEVHVIEDVVRGKFFQIGNWEHLAIQNFDGSRDATAIQVDLEQQYPQVKWDVSSIAHWLMQNGLAIVPNIDSSVRLQNQSQSLRLQSMLSWLNLISIRIPLFHASRILNRADGLGRLLFSRLAFIIWFLVVGFATIQFGLAFQNIGVESSIAIQPNEWFWLLAVWIGLKVVHELGHGLACQRYGGQAGEFGLTFILFTPMANVDVTSSWRFNNKWKRIVTAAAGMYIEIFVAAVALIAWSLLDQDHPFKGTLYKIFLAASLTTVLFNANPLMKFDGYYLFSDWLEIPNLYSKGAKWLSQFAAHWILGWPLERQAWTARERFWVISYGIGSFAWRIIVSVGLIIGASVLFHGAGIAIAAAAIVTWYAIPLLKLVGQLHTGASQPIRSTNLFASLAVFTVMIWLLFGSVSGPTTQSAPAFARYQDETSLRAPCNSFIHAIHVHDDSAVSHGQLLVTLRNDELEQEIGTLREKKYQAETRAKVLLQKDELAMYQAESQHQQSLSQQLIEKLNQQKKLQICAPFDGFVIARGLDRQLGKYLNAGDPIMVVASNKDAEIVASIDQIDLDSLQQNSSCTFSALFAGCPKMDCQVKRVDPRATLIPEHRGLCADAGGSIPITTASHTQRPGESESEVHFLTPRFNVELSVRSVNPLALRSGQVGHVVFPTRRQSLGQYLYLSVYHWIDRKLKAAVQADAQ